MSDRQFTIKHIIIHHSAITGDVPVENIRVSHKRKGYRDIGYHYYIEKDGVVKIGRKETDMGAHCKADGMNWKSLGVCLAGDFTQETPTPEQISSCRSLVYSIKHRYDIESVLGHKEVEGASTLCPVIDLDELDLRNPSF